MKSKLLFPVLLVLVLIGKSVHAQLPYFIPASPLTPEYYNPPGISPFFDNILHTCAYSLGGSQFVYSWSPAPHPVLPSMYSNDAGFVFKNTTYGTEGYKLYSDVIYLDVSIINLEGASMIFASYYKLEDGHFYDIWKWDPASGSIGPYSLDNRLSYSSIGTKISMDAHRGYGVLISWVDEEKLFVKCFNSISGTLLQSPNVLVDNAPGAIVPDIAFAHADDLKARIVYIEKTSGNINVISYKFDPLFMTTSQTFNFDYTQSGVYAYMVGGSYPLTTDLYAMLSFCLQLDCPDHSDFDRWSYVYSKIADDNVVMAVSKYAPGPPAIMNLSDPLKGQYLTIAYDGEDPYKIHYGWYSLYPNPLTAPNQAGYVSVERRVDGAYITPVHTFKRILLNPAIGIISKGLLSFSRNNESRFFIVYPYENLPSTKNIAHKILPWGMSTFGHMATLGTSDILNNDISVSPNPFSQGFELAVEGADNSAQILEVSLVNDAGQVIQVLEGTIQDVNSRLKSVGKNLPAGHYFIRITGDGSDLMKTLKAVKL